MIAPASAAPAPAPGDATAAAGAPPADPDVREAARGMEGLFMSILVEEMMKGTGIAEQSPVHAGLLTEKLGDELAASGGLGLAALIERRLGGAG